MPLLIVTVIIVKNWMSLKLSNNWNSKNKTIDTLDQSLHETLQQTLDESTFFYNDDQQHFI